MFTHLLINNHQEFLGYCHLYESFNTTAVKTNNLLRRSCEPPCALAYDNMPFCVDANQPAQVILKSHPYYHNRDGLSKSASRCQQLTVSDEDGMS